MESVHGHELMRWLGANGPLPREAVLQGAAGTFGEDCRFHTCSLSDLDASALVDFLVSKGKIAEGARGLYLAMQPCDH
ncbi:MAG: YecH family protein [Fibrobacteria bacterium]|nr:YecH family protein [Fibrobacteria bacterium]